MGASVIILSILVLLISLWAIILDNRTPNSSTDKEKFNLNDIYRSYQKMVDEYGVDHQKMAIGYNTNLDLIVSAVSLMKMLGFKEPMNSGVEMKVINEIKTLDDFKDLFQLYFKEGSAVERFIGDNDLCQKIIESSQMIPEKSLYVGGNAALMAVKFVEFHSKVLLAGSVGEQLRKLLPMTEITTVDSDNVKEEIHLILEYGAGEKWGSLKAPRANRIIVHCDYSNSKLDTVDDFHNKMDEFNPDKIIITGFHLLQGEEPSFRTNKIKEVVSKLPKSKPVHLELASISDFIYIKELANTVVPYVDSLGLNEQEISYLVNIMRSDRDILTDEELSNIQKKFKYPKLSLIVEEILFLFEKPTRLTRIHFHTLRFHIVAQKMNNIWGNNSLSVVAGSYVASKQSCQIDENSDVNDILINQFEDDKDIWGNMEKIKYDPRYPIVIEKKGISFAIAPVLVCKQPKKTVGLGDAISAAGLFYHQTFATRH